MIYQFSVHRVESESAPGHLTQLLPDLTTWRRYYLESVEEFTDAQRHAVATALIEPLTERVVEEEPFGANQVQVAYKRGIVDNENDSIVGLCNMLGVPVVAARVATVYSSAHGELALMIDAEACNANIEELFTSAPDYDSLRPIASFVPMESYDLRSLSDEQLAELGKFGGRSMELDKMQRAREIQIATGAETVSDAFLEAMDARWSDHCAHTTWKSLGSLLKRLIEAAKATKNPNIVSMFYDNAGIWNFYDGYGLAIKAETHNGPSAVSAYFGQLTKLGGVLRDILGTGLGADPIGSFEYTATGLPESPSPIAGRPTPKQIANETIRAIKEYGNTFGVPMLQSHMTFNDDYRAKPFALGGSIGLIPNEFAQKGSPQPGDYAVIIGGLTGNDGIHGASGSSAGAVMDSTAVQLGSPLEEIKFAAAIMDLRDAGLLRALTDMGAAGVNSAFGEMGEETGVWINTALVPLKTGGLPMWRILLSESQERMALAIAPEDFTKARSIMDRHEVRNTIIGKFTDTHRYCVVYDEDLSEKHIIEMDIDSLPPVAELGFDVSYELLEYEPAPIATSKPSQTWRTDSEWPRLDADKLVHLSEIVLGDCEIADQSLAALQYDSSVQGRTFYGPYVGDRHVATGFHVQRPVYGHPGGSVFSTSFNPWLFEAHPVLAARQHFLSILTGQVLAGVDVTDICLCDNFYTPHLEPHAYDWLVAMVDELAALSRQFGVPFISGKDSSAGSTHTDEGVVSVPPGVFLTALGKIPNAEHVRQEQWTAAGNLLVRIGLSTPSLAGTAAARALDLDANDVDEVDATVAASFINELYKLPLDVAPSGRLISNGGVLGNAVIGAQASQLGAELEIGDDKLHELLQEHRIGAVIEVPADKLDSLPSSLSPVVVGHITSDHHGVRVNGTGILTGEALHRWGTSFEEALA